MKKKVLALVSCIAMISLNVNVLAQQATIDSAVRPAAYKLRYGLFKSYPNSTKDIIFLGNSITQGVDWAELLQPAESKLQEQGYFGRHYLWRTGKIERSDRRKTG